MKEITRKILLIDDDEDDRWLFTEALARTVPSVTCLTASGGEHAIEILQNENILPDVIFMDLNMPGLDGKRCLALIKSFDRFKAIPIIVYSTSNFHRDIEETKKMGALKFIMKPSGYTQLCDLFRQVFPADSDRINL